MKYLFIASSNFSLLLNNYLKSNKEIVDSGFFQCMKYPKSSSLITSFVFKTGEIGMGRFFHPIEVSVPFHRPVIFQRTGM
jgi:hypothetical protein